MEKERKEPMRDGKVKADLNEIAFFDEIKHELNFNLNQLRLYGK